MQVCHWSYMSPLIVTGVNIVGSKFVTKTTEIEGWSPRTEIKVCSIIYAFDLWRLGVESR